jgi:2-polyprenyl-6-methoxyphenol hydroxylase-like FAD-dependent oxidoreductase
MLGVLPTGATLDDPARLVSVFWSVELARADAVRAAGIDAYKSAMLEMNPAVAPLVEQITSFEQVALARYMDVRMRPWHRGSVVFIGDSAHATSPQLGQGVNLALVDALALSECVASYADLPSALSKYYQLRRRQLSYYQFTTRWLTPFFQSRSRVLGWARDLAFPLAGVLSPLRKQMVWTMCGVKRGFLRKSLPMPQLPGRPDQKALADPEPEE